VKLDLGTRYAAYLWVLMLIVVSTALAAAGLVISSRAAALQREIQETIVAAERSENEQELEGVAAYLSRRLFAPLARLDVRQLDQEVEQVRMWLPVTEFLVIDAEGRVLTDGTRAIERYGERIEGPLPRDAPWEPVLRKSSDGTELRLAVRAEDVVVGWAVVKVADAPFMSSLRRLETRTATLWSGYQASLLWVGALILGITVLLAGVTSAWLSRTLARPLTEMSRAARDFAAGRFDHVVALDSRDEIGELARSLNKMAADLQAHDAERERLIEDLGRKNTELEQFTYTVSHDLKSPLVTIQGFVGLIARELESGDQGRVPDLLSRVAAASEKMNRLLEDLLELSRIGRIVNPPADVELGELAREAVELVRGRLDSRGVAVDISPDLPAVRGDRQRLREVLQNLVENAVKFLGEQSDPRIEIGVRRDAAEQVLYVADNGRGIEASYLERVFDLFETLDPHAGGTGVGLTLVRRIIEAHGGRVWAESPGPGGGTRICFTLPGDPKGPLSPPG
jgi:signal transduction histidine kinase